MGSGRVTAGGAELYYETHGAGPDMLLIAGAGGTAASFTGVVPFLAERFRLVTYDRRGLNRSTGRDSHAGTMRQQAADVLAVLDAAGAERPIVFGTCGGASIGFELSARYPDRVRGLVAHEPITVRVLDDAAAQLEFFRQMCEQNVREGPMPAMMRWMTYMGRDFELKIRPAFRERTLADGDFVFRHDLMPMVEYLPDASSLADRVPVTLAVGEGSRKGDYSYARTVLPLARMLGCEVAEIPGHHTSYIYRPDVFGPALGEQALSLIGRLASKATNE
ncbi:alpha/beta hydrolase [Micromonospora sp. CPCC 205371]|nr:alpha/beta hydrolase [Micromonospora sp. CPCC 205371]